MKRHVVARVEDVPEGERIVVDVGGRSVGVFNLDGEFFGLLNRCPHRGGPMCEGIVVGELLSSTPGEYRLDPGRRYLQCPWHGWEFDIRTGRSYVDPVKIRIRPYPVEVRTGAELTAGRVEGPYTATTVQVTVEDDYLVVVV
jgi:3-phenylpropionate/trans-cinnamate dioxygenase ferredoxin subunit